MPGRGGLPVTLRAPALGFAALLLALVGTALLYDDRVSLAQAVPEVAPGTDCSACTLRHRALLKRAGRCRIKGAVGGKGERIYFLPGVGGDERADLDLARGERWFCTEEEARAAGWKAARE